MIPDALKDISATETGHMVTISVASMVSDCDPATRHRWLFCCVLFCLLQFVVCLFVAQVAFQLILEHIIME